MDRTTALLKEEVTQLHARMDQLAKEVDILKAILEKKTLEGALCSLPTKQCATCEEQPSLAL